VPLANVDQTNHAPNENLDLDWFRRGIVGAAAIQLALAGHGEATGGWQSGSP
jgi:hypothetical protein